MNRAVAMDTAFVISDAGLSAPSVAPTAGSSNSGKTFSGHQWDGIVMMWYGL